MGRLDGKVALITGVSSGIGQAAARLFAKEGAFILGVDCNMEAGQALAETLQQQNLEFQFLAADLSADLAPAAVVERCYQLYGRVAILYNNAGISIVEPFSQVNQASLDRLFAINFTSVFRLCQEAIPGMKRQGGGTIINTASELAIVAQPFFTAYCATKGAVLAFTRSLALEYARDNIRINALCPGPIDTPMLQQEFETESDPAKAREESIASIPLGRLGRPDEIAKVALFLASEAPPLMHGSSIVVDGAKTIF